MKGEKDDDSLTSDILVLVIDNKVILPRSKSVVCVAVPNKHLPDISGKYKAR